MIRNRIPRFRNLQNLHVIPTASNFNSKPIPVLAESPNITIIPHPLSTTVDISNTNCEQKMFNQNKPKGRFNKPRKNRNRRKRQPKCFPLTEAEIRNSSYNWYDPSYLNQTVYSDPPQEKIEEIDENIPEIPIEEDFEEVEVASEDGDGKQEILVGFRASKLQYLNYKKKCFFRPKFYKFGSQRTLVNCLNVQDNSSVDIDIVSEAEYEIDEVDNLDQSDSQDQQISKINKSYEHSERNQEEKPIEKSKVVEINDVNESSKRIFKTCIEENADINQGQSLIQSSFDTWKSHLIGLEYLIEIQDKNKAKYYCVLCSEYLPVEEIPSINVINHINGCKHVIGYLEKHFPSYGFKFDENNVDTQRKVCEEINEKMGYFSICITNFDYFNKNEQKIKNIILNASHVNEECIKLETCVYQKEKDSDTLKDVQYVIENIIEKVLIFVENKTMDSEDVLVENSSVEVENESNHIVSSELLSDSVKKANKKYKCKESKPKNSLKSPKSFLKYKNNSNLSSYLKVKYAKAKSKGLMPLKGLSNRNRRLSAEKGEKRKSREEKHVDKTSSPTEPEEVISEFIHSDTSKKVVEDKEKVLQKPTVHSKHCRKRILGRETRLKETTKECIKEEFISSTAKMSKEKCVPISELENKSSSKRIDQSLKLSDNIATPSNNSSPAQKVAPIQKVYKQDSKSSVTKHSKSAHKDICKKSIESSKLEKDMVKNSSSNWKAMTRSPVKSPDNSHTSKSETRKHSGSPPTKRTVRRISKSPLRLLRRSPVRKFSRSPVRKHSRSPFRRKSRSPFWKHSRSPFRKKSRSPIRKRSRSPLGRHSRSPVRRYSRGSFRRRSRSPVRRYSRSPVRRRSRSPLRRRSRSPLRRRSRSPWRRISRSPVRRNSRSPVRRRSRSPVRKHSRSPIKRLRSPIRKHSRGSVSVSQSPPKEFRSIFKAMSSNSNQDHITSDKRFSQNVYNYDENLGKHDRDFIKVRSSKNYLSPSNSVPDKHKSHTFASSTMRGTSDLDPVSDEDESIYFDKQRVEECITSPSSKKMLAQFLQKFSVSNVNPDDPSLNKLMLFMEAHKAEIEELMGSQATSKAGKTNVNTVDPNLQERNLFLQQYLLSNLAGGDQEQGLSSLNLNKKTKYQQPPFLSETDNVGSGIVHNVAPHNHPQSNLPRFFPPNVNVPPPDPYRPFNQPHQEFSPKPQVPQEVMFKDLKATVSKLFGANESATKLDKNKSRVPEYVTEPDPEKWDLSHPDTLKFNAPAKFSAHAGPRFNAPINQKNVFHPQGNSDNFSSTPESSVMRADIPGTYNNNSPGQFFSGRGIDRSQGLNVTVPPPDAKVSFCDVPRNSSKGNLFPVVHNVNSNFGSPSAHGSSISDVKVSLAQRLASVLVKIGMTDVPAPLLQEMLMKIGAFSSLPRQDISEAEIISILKRLGYLF